MIKVARGVQPGVLRRNADVWKTKFLAASPSQRKRWSEKYGHPEVRAALEEMFHGKCAYCESHIGHAAYGRIDHFRPRSLFPELTFEWENLLLACEICNGTNCKGSKFPAKKDGGPLVNPCAEDPADHLRFEYDYKSKLASVYGKTRRGEVTVEILGLNRPDLRADRWKKITRLFALAQSIEENAEARRIVQEACIAAHAGSEEYSAFVRQLCGEA